MEREKQGVILQIPEVQYELEECVNLAGSLAEEIENESMMKKKIQVII